MDKTSDYQWFGVYANDSDVRWLLEYTPTGEIIARVIKHNDKEFEVYWIGMGREPSKRFTTLERSQQYAMHSISPYQFPRPPEEIAILELRCAELEDDITRICNFLSFVFGDNFDTSFRVRGSRGEVLSQEEVEDLLSVITTSRTGSEDNEILELPSTAKEIKK